MPKLFLLPEYIVKHEYEDLIAFLGKDWSSMTGDQLEKYFEAIFWFTPEAFCYYLPGIFSAGINDDIPELIVNHSVVEMLDRSQDYEMWDEFFLERWPLLSTQECEAAQEWILWLSSCGETSFSDNSLSRSFDTLELLKTRQAAK